MASKSTSASGTSVSEKKRQYERTIKNKNIDQYAVAEDAIKTLRDVTKTSTKSISTFNKESLRSYLSAIGSNETNLRNLSRYLYYRSHIYFRLISFYSGMFDLRCRKVVPRGYSLVKNNNEKTILRNYSNTLELLDKFNLQGNMAEILPRCFIEDVCYSIFFHDDSGAFFYVLDPQYCKIDTRYMTGDFGFSMDMSQWKSATKQKEIEWLGEPLTTMYKEYESTNQRWVHCPDEYAACFKFRIDDWQTVIPPFISLFQSLINLEDLADVQAIADEQQIYKLVYLPMKILSGTKQSDDFEVSPDLMLKYFDRLIDEALPDYVSAAPIPGDELKTIDFNDNAAKDTDRVEQAATTVLNTSGGGMVLNTSKITTQAGFKAALQCETEFAVSTLLPQINGFCNRMLIGELGDKASKVEHLELSVYTKQDVADELLKSCQYSFSNRLAYNTCLGMSERDTLAMEFLENNILKLPTIMNHPLSSSFTSSSNDADYTPEPSGAPTKDEGDLSDEGSASRDKG